MMDHQLEHQTGLILPKSPIRHEVSPPPSTSSNIGIIRNTTVMVNIQPIAHPILEALRSLRDSNPSLARKLLNNGQTGNDDDVNATDDSMDYWNKCQQMVVLDQEEFTEIHLGGLMVRITNVRPFLEALYENRISLCTVNFGGTDVAMDNFLLGMNHVETCWKKLYLGGCAIGSRGGVHDLAKVIGLCPDLTVLDLRYNDLSGKDMEQLESVLSNHCNLSILYLEGNRLSCEGAKVIGRIIANHVNDHSNSNSNSHSNNTCLKELYLGSNNIGVDGAMALAKGLEQNSSLEKLYLDGNAIGNEGALAFTKILLSQTTTQTKVLEHLYVDNNGIGKDAAMKLGRALNSDGLITGDGSFFG
mmetsp:Transcript_6462/g.12171  ORF Transcript_6462/g.12171 Transcript_6462/m.12171 type:complete len:359 (-) Transcript_6462:2856-3932(-)